MPKKSGIEAYEEIRKQQPAIRILFTSGYTADIIHRKGIVEEDQHFISKPVPPDTFLRKIRRCWTITLPSAQITHNKWQKRFSPASVSPEIFKTGDLIW